MKSFDEKEIEILARLTCFAVYNVIWADEEASEIELGPIGGSVENYKSFPIPLYRDILQFINDNGGPDFFGSVISELDNDGVWENIINSAREVIDDLNSEDRGKILAGLYGILLDTTHADGEKDVRETQVTSMIFQDITTITPEDIKNMDSLWRKAASGRII